MWQWLNQNASVLGVIIAIVPVVWGAMTYLAQKRQELRAKRFETYHLLIKRLVEREDKNLPMMLDRQLAVVFELRNFQEYYDPSLRIIKGLRDAWAGQYGPKDKNKRLIEEMDATISWMNLYKSSRFNRCFCRPMWCKKNS
jgi:hypothetical protein